MHSMALEMIPRESSGEKAADDNDRMLVGKKGGGDLTPPGQPLTSQSPVPWARACGVRDTRMIAAAFKCLRLMIMMKLICACGR
jgi:hypothetical protein